MTEQLSSHQDPDVTSAHVSYGSPESQCERGLDSRQVCQPTFFLFYQVTIV